MSTPFDQVFEAQQIPQTETYPTIHCIIAVMNDLLQEKIVNEFCKRV